MQNQNENRKFRSDGTEIVDTRNRYQKLFDEKYHPRILELLRQRETADTSAERPGRTTIRKIIAKSELPSIEIVGLNVAKPLPKKKVVIGPDGKSIWYEEVGENG